MPDRITSAGDGVNKDDQRDLGDNVHQLADEDVTSTDVPGKLGWHHARGVKVDPSNS
jgi:hypothetical protein